MGTVLLRGYRFRHEADLDRAILDAAGIRSIVIGDDAGGMGPHIMSDNPIRLYVAEEEASAAEEALSEGPPELDGDMDTV
jgi:hypothetical protein